MEAAPLLSAAGLESLPDDMLLRCLQPLTAMGAHAAVSALCQRCQDVARDDRLWAERLAQDFPLAAREKPAGTLHRVYRMLAKSRLAARRSRREIGPAAIFGAVEGMLPPTPVDGLEMPLPGAGGCRAIRQMAARFHAMNAQIEEHIEVRRGPVVVAERDVPPRGPAMRPRPAGPPGPPPPAALAGRAWRVTPAAAGGWSALLADIQARRVD